MNGDRAWLQAELAKIPRGNELVRAHKEKMAQPAAAAFASARLKQLVQILRSETVNQTNEPRVGPSVGIFVQILEFNFKTCRHALKDWSTLLIFKALRSLISSSR